MGEWNVPSLSFGGALNLFADFEGEFGEALEGDFLAGVQSAEDVFDGDADLLHEVETALVKQPPAQAQISSICLEVVSVGLLKVIVVMVLQIYP